MTRQRSDRKYKHSPSFVSTNCVSLPVFLQEFFYYPIYVMPIDRATTAIAWLLFFGGLQAYDDEYEETTTKCNEHETFNLSDMGAELTFSGKATCDIYEKIFQFNPDLNAKRGHVLTVSEASGKTYLNFHISEFTLNEDGTIARTITRPGEIVGAHTWFAPTTGIMVQFSREGGTSEYEYTFSATISLTPTNHHCPFPFVDLQPDVPVILADTLIEYYCDAVITAPPGYDVRIDHIKDTSVEHTLVIKILDDERNELEWFETFPIEQNVPGANPIIVDVNSRGQSSHQVEIQVSAVKLNCTCGPPELVFNYSLERLVFQSPDYPNAHCRMVPCQTTFSLLPELRPEYKMRLSRFDILSHGNIEIDQGTNGVTTQNDRLTRSFTFESPSFTIKYRPEGKRYGDVFSIDVDLVERQEGCDCPHQSAIASQFAIEIPGHCEQLDCLYELPQFDDNTVNYDIQLDATNDYVGSRRTGRTSDRYSYDSGDGIYEYDDWKNRNERMIIRYHRENPVSRPSHFNFTYTTTGHHISHAQRCGCLNQTIVLESNQSRQITSPNWPEHYCNNLACVQTWVAPVHHHLEVKLATISLEPNKDRIAFFEGTNITAKHIDLIIGEEIVPDAISSSASVMTTVFISNGAVSFDGFNGTITAVMDKSWSDHLKHHISGWWWLIAIVAILIIACAALLVWKRHGLMRRPNNVNLLEL